MATSGQWTEGVTSRRPLQTVLIVFLLCFTVYNANCRLIATGDSEPARMIPFAILDHGTVFLDSYSPFPPDAWWIQRDRLGHWSSVFPIVLPVLLTPVYVPAAIYVRIAHPPPWRFATLCGVMEKLSAALVTSLSVVVLLLVLRNFATESTAILLTIAYAFGTETWAISSQGLWQHGPAELLLGLALWLLTREPTPRLALLAGCLCSLMVFNRPPDFFLALAFAAAYLWRSRTHLSLFVLGALATGTPFLLYNMLLFRRPTGGYAILLSRALQGHPLSERLSSMITGVPALLVSPGKGLFVYCPFLLFLIGAPLLRFPGTGRLPTRLFWAAFAAQVLVYSTWDWRGGWCYGPRFLTDAIPFLVLALAPAVERLRPRRGLPVFLVCVVSSILVQAVGVFCFPGGGSVFLTQQELWKPGGAQFYREARVGFPRAEYFHKVRRWMGVSPEPPPMVR